MSLFHNRKAVLIDLDGTLVDSVPDLAYGIDEMMQQLGMPIRGVDACLLYTSPSPRDS